MLTGLIGNELMEAMDAEKVSGPLLTLVQRLQKPSDQPRSYFQGSKLLPVRCINEQSRSQAALHSLTGRLAL